MLCCVIPFWLLSFTEYLFLVPSINVQAELFGCSYDATLVLLFSWFGQFSSLVHIKFKYYLSLKQGVCSESPQILPYVQRI